MQKHENKTPTPNSILNIGYNYEMSSYTEAISDYMEVQEGYMYPLDDLMLDQDEFEGFKKELFDEFEGITVYDYSNGNNFFEKWKHGNFSLYIRGNHKEKILLTQCKSEKTCEYIFNLYKKHSNDKNDIQIFMTTYSEKSNNTKIYDKDEFSNISKSYYPYIDTEMMFKQFSTGNENILLLVGKPGIGKSKLVSCLLDFSAHNPDYLPYDKLEDDLDQQFISVGYVKSANVLADEKFWDTISKAQHDFVIMDDLDFMLTRRDSEVNTSDDQIRNAFLGFFLPFTDGIQENKTKFIITTNQNYENIDSALLRKGRLFDILELRDLGVDEALVIWKEYGLKEEDFSTLFEGVHEIQPADLGSEISKKLNTRLSNNSGNYLLECGISKVKDAKRNKKIKL